MRIKKLPVGHFEMNAYIVAGDASADCFLIDPGDDPAQIIGYIEQNKLAPGMIINTHNHIDHARRVSDIQKHFGIPFFMAEADLPLLESLPSQGLFFGMEASDVPQIERFLLDGETLKLAGLSLKILHTPGHSPGSVSILCQNHVFVGDVLFREAIGRTDLYGGNYQTLIESIRQKLLVLPDETIVHPGHGPDTTIGWEKTHNPFLTQGPVSL